MPSIDTASLSTQIDWNSHLCKIDTFYLFRIFMYFVCTVPFPLLEKLAQAAKVTTDTVISFSNVFSTKKVLSDHKIGLCWIF